MKRLAIGAALGGLAVYLYDPQLGTIRRGRLASLWQENREGVLQAGRVASDTVDSARPMARRLTSAIGSSTWPGVLGRARPAAGAPRLIGAAALGAAAVYFLDPVNGSARRLHALGTARSALREVAEIVKPAGGQIQDSVTNAVDRMRSRVS